MVAAYSTAEPSSEHALDATADAHGVIEAVRERRKKAGVAMPGDRAAAFDEGSARRSPREEP